MTLESIYYIGQTLAVIGILASILMVWRQLKQGQKMERAAAQRDVLLRANEWMRMVFQKDGDAFDTFILGLQEYTSADALTQMHIDKCLCEHVILCETAMNMHKDGFFSDGTWEGVESGTLTMLRTPGGQQWWAIAQHLLGSEVCVHITQRLSEIDPAAPNYLDIVPSCRNRLKELAAIADAKAEKEVKRPQKNAVRMQNCEKIKNKQKPRKAQTNDQETKVAN